MKFQQREGHANVPQKHKEEGDNLGQWLQDQRQQKKTRKLDISREKLLDKIGIVWSQPTIKQWRCYSHKVWRPS